MFLSWHHHDRNRDGKLDARTLMVVNNTTSQGEPGNRCTQHGDGSHLCLRMEQFPDLVETVPI